MKICSLRMHREEAMRREGGEEGKGGTRCPEKWKTPRMMAARHRSADDRVSRRVKREKRYRLKINGAECREKTS